ncbi:protein of unknown function [Xenorhabdus poinarii G6]|uniref:Uncharacterized protein n=1 Tax=Xenorhabdus poinarii G6 TaxID=1354304 RepID=A0A068R239_9GAMM|nr:protein of unknown function [Xenorhabdus poinarii G6]
MKEKETPFSFLRIENIYIYSSGRVNIYPLGENILFLLSFKDNYIRICYLNSVLIELNSAI